MKRLRYAAAFIALAGMVGAQTSAFAQDHHGYDHGHGPGPDHGHYVHHQDWRNGGHISHNDWNRGARVDYRAHHLHAPPRGYEWREVDGNYVLAAVATGLIASVLLANH
ncbi:MAG TPA: RcnB family protein [Stellaceae bacterium]|jgi:Ni/Co efflux regulator RcnB|nr:RcnB family protein [Stellaceae bacterium]